MKWLARISLTEQSDRKQVNVVIEISNEQHEHLYTYTAITHDAYLCFHRGWHWRKNMINVYCQHATQHFNVSLRLTRPVTHITTDSAVLHPSIFETHRFDESRKLKLKCYQAMAVARMHTRSCRIP